MSPPDDPCASLTARLETAPNDFEAWIELARLKNAARQAPEALAAAANALTLRPGSLEALYERGRAQLEMGSIEQAAGAFSSILAIQPLHPGVLVSLGWAYYELRCLEQASLIWEQAVRVAPEPVEIMENLAICYQRLGEFEKVAAVWKQVLQSEPAHPLALHHLAALGHSPAPPRCADEYLVKLFDEFAGEFDATLGSLGYDGPSLLARFVAAHTPDMPRGWHILDVGCGTGLCAVPVRPWAAWLEGVDLSPQMLAKAKARCLYDALHCAELGWFCDAHPTAYDLVIAADCINYSGDLQQVARSMARSLRPGGRCTFFVERMEEPIEDRGFRLERHGRYSHQPQYVTDCLAAAGLKVQASTEAVIRAEQARPVVATLFLAG